jgi:cell division protein FtsL
VSLAEKRATYQPSVARQPVKKRSLPVKRRTRASKRPLLLNVLVLALVICSGLTVAARGATLASVGYQIEDCRAQLAAVQEENRRLALQVASLESTQRIEAEAGARLGMVRPGAPQVIAATPAIESDILTGSGQLAFAEEIESELSLAGLLSWAQTAVAGFLSSPGQVEAGETR